MADKNIQMTQRNASNTGWDNLYPITKAENVKTSDGSDLAAHLADTTKHVTQAEKDTWNSMQKHKVTADDGSAINISGQDLNNIKMTGIYMGDNLTNAPITKAAGNWCYIEVIRHNDTYIIQKAYKLNSGQNSLYMRRCENGVWSSWSEDLFQSVRDGKLNVRNAITNKGGTVADANGDGIPTFDELVTGVNSIPTGKKFASGTATIDSYGFIAVNSLTFKPTVISCFYPTNKLYFIVYDGNRNVDAYLRSNNISVSLHSLSGQTSYVNDTGFYIYTAFTPGWVVNWYAYE